HGLHQSFPSLSSGMPRSCETFLRNSSWDRSVLHKGEPHLAGAAVQVADDALAISLLVVVDAWIHIGHAVAQGIVEEHRQLACRGSDRLGLADASREPPVEG